MRYLVKHRIIARLSFLSLLLMVGIGHAGTDIGQFCWAFGEFADTIRLSVTQANDHHTGPEASELMYEAAIQWRGLHVYQLLGSGVITESLPTEGMLEGGFSLTNPHASAFGGHRNCAMRILLNPEPGINYLNGTWLITCTGSTAENFNNSGTLVHNPSCLGETPPVPMSLSQATAQGSKLAGNPRP